MQICKRINILAPGYFLNYWYMALQGVITIIHLSLAFVNKLIFYTASFLLFLVAKLQYLLMSFRMSVFLSVRFKEKRDFLAAYTY